MAEFNYARHQIISATRVLATYPADMKTRLRKAYLDHLNFALVDDVPENLKPHLRSIHERMTCKDPKWKGQGRVDATLLRMHAKTASKIADSIWELFRSVIETK